MLNVKSLNGIFFVRVTIIILLVVLVSSITVEEDTSYAEQVPLSGYVVRTHVESLSSVPDNKLTQIWKKEAQASVTRLNKYKQYIQNSILENCCIEPKLIHAMIIGESHAMDELSPRKDTGACGPLQVTHIAKKELVRKKYFADEDNRCDVKTNIEMGVAYMWYLENEIGIKDVKLRIIAYNEGPGGSKKFIHNQDQHKYLQRIAYSYNML